MNYYLPMIEHLGFYVGRDINNFTEKSYELIDKIYEAMECIKEVGRDEKKIIYVKYKRCDFKSYKKFYLFYIWFRSSYFPTRNYILFYI